MSVLRRFQTASACFALCAGLAGAVPAAAAPGDLDASFDADGRVLTDIPSPVDEANGVAVQPDGRIVVAGLKGGSEWDFALARYNADGSLDTTFDGDGKVVTNLGAYVDQAAAVALQPDGKIVAAGWSNDDFAVARYNPDGSLDTSFDSDGWVTTDVTPSPDLAFDIIVQPDGKIVAAGGSYDFGVVRYNADGSLDTGFDSDGEATVDFGAYDVGKGVALAPGGKLVVGGHSDQGATARDYAVTRLNADGSLDTGFDSDGKLTTDFSAGDDELGDLAVQADGKVVAGGWSDQSATGKDFAVARYNADGSPDSTFESDGKATTDFAGLDDWAGGMGSGLVIHPTGKIVAGGLSDQGATGLDFALAAYNADGTPDTGFGGDGKATTHFGVGSDGIVDLAVQADGKIVAAGWSSQDTTGVDFALARYDGPAPSSSLPTSKHDCKNGGWKLFFDGDTRFKNQGDCVSYVATGGANPPAGG